MCGFMSGSSIDSIDQCICFYANAMQFYYSSSIVELELRNGETSNGSFIVQDSFSALVFLLLPVKLFFPRSVKNSLFLFSPRKTNPSELFLVLQ